MPSKSQKTLLIATILFLLITISLLFFLYYEIKKNVKVAQELDKILEEEVLKRNEVKTLNNYFKSIQTEKTLLETHFVQSFNVVLFLNSLEDLAYSVETKTEVSSISVTKENDGLIVELKNSGTFPRVYKFISLLENAPYELEFLSVDVHKFISSEEKALTNQWEAVIRLKLISFI